MMERIGFPAASHLAALVVVELFITSTSTQRQMLL
jgi:hypothetical protein